MPISRTTPGFAPPPREAEALQWRTPATAAAHGARQQAVGPVVRAGFAAAAAVKPEPERSVGGGGPRELAALVDELAEQLAPAHGAAREASPAPPPPPAEVLAGAARGARPPGAAPAALRHGSVPSGGECSRLGPGLLARLLLRCSPPTSLGPSTDAPAEDTSDCVGVSPALDNEASLHASETEDTTVDACFEHSPPTGANSDDAHGTAVGGCENGAGGAAVLMRKERQDVICAKQLRSREEEACRKWLEMAPFSLHGLEALKLPVVPAGPWVQTAEVGPEGPCPAELLLPDVRDPAGASPAPRAAVCLETSVGLGRLGQELCQASAEAGAGGIAHGPTLPLAAAAAPENERQEQKQEHKQEQGQKDEEEQEEEEKEEGETEDDATEEAAMVAAAQEEEEEEDGEDDEGEEEEGEGDEDEEPQGGVGCGSRPRAQSSPPLHEQALPGRSPTSPHDGRGSGGGPPAQAAELAAPRAPAPVCARGPLGAGREKAWRGPAHWLEVRADGGPPGSLRTGEAASNPGIAPRRTDAAHGASAPDERKRHNKMRRTGAPWRAPEGAPGPGGHDPEARPAARWGLDPDGGAAAAGRTPTTAVAAQGRGEGEDPGELARGRVGSELGAMLREMEVAVAMAEATLSASILATSAPADCCGARVPEARGLEPPTPPELEALALLCRGASPVAASHTPNERRQVGRVALDVVACPELDQAGGAGAGTPCTDIAVQNAAVSPPPPMPASVPLADFLAPTGAPSLDCPAHVQGSAGVSTAVAVQPLLLASAERAALAASAAADAAPAPAVPAPLPPPAALVAATPVPVPAPAPAPAPTVAITQRVDCALCGRRACCEADACFCAACRRRMDALELASLGGPPPGRRRPAARGGCRGAASPASSPASSAGSECSWSSAGSSGRSSPAPPATPGSAFAGRISSCVRCGGRFVCAADAATNLLCQRCLS